MLLSGIVLMTLFGSFFYDQDPTRIIARPSRAPARTGLTGTDISAVTCFVVNGGSTSLTVALVAVSRRRIGDEVPRRLLRRLDRPLLSFTEVRPGTAVRHGHRAEPSARRCDCDWSASRGTSTPCGVPATQNLEFVKAARAVGASDSIIWRVIFPTLPP